MTGMLGNAGVGFLVLFGIFVACLCAPVLFLVLAVGFVLVVVFLLFVIVGKFIMLVLFGQQ